MTDIVQIIDLTQVAQKENLPQGSAAELQAAFVPYFERAAEWRDKAMAIKVTSLHQTKEMGEARAARLALKDIRVNTEKTRVKLKEESLRTGKAIDGMANVIKFLVTPIEEYLEEQEKYGERLAAQQRAIVRDERECQAGKYLSDFPQSVDLGAIDECEFAKLLQFAKAQFDAREETAQRLESERIEREKREAAEREAMRAENERLKAEAQEREKAMAEERAERERVQREHEAKIAAERAEVDRLRMEAEAKERAERERVQREQAEKERAEKAASEAPDKEKLLRYADQLLSVEIPKIESEALNQKLAEAKSLIRRAIQLISEA